MDGLTGPIALYYRTTALASSVWCWHLVYNKQIAPRYKLHVIGDVGQEVLAACKLLAKCSDSVRVSRVWLVESVWLGLGLYAGLFGTQVAFWTFGQKCRTSQLLQADPPSSARIWRQDQIISLLQMKSRLRHSICTAWHFCDLLQN